MRPGSLDALRGIQTAIAEAIVPELQTVFAQDVAQVNNMLIESIAADWDSLVEDLQVDSSAVRALLEKAVSVLSPMVEGNELLSAHVTEIKGTLSPGSNVLRISELTSENDTLRGALERTLVALEDIAAGPGDASAMALREAVYAHLRTVSAAGWSFWDVSSFRERMTALKSEDK
jgi:hypothetical protein